MSSIASITKYLWNSSLTACLLLTLECELLKDREGVCAIHQSYLHLSCTANPLTNALSLPAAPIPIHPCTFCCSITATTGPSISSLDYNMAFKASPAATVSGYSLFSTWWKTDLWQMDEIDSKSWFCCAQNPPELLTVGIWPLVPVFNGNNQPLERKDPDL